LHTLRPFSYQPWLEGALLITLHFGFTDLPLVLQNGLHIEIFMPRLVSGLLGASLSTHLAFGRLMDVLFINSSLQLFSYLLRLFIYFWFEC
jgi:hypothetical protein